MLASIIIRTLNEEKHLEDLLLALKRQECGALRYEIIVVDSGSEDRTLEIASSYGCNLVHIAREDFSFGKSLNLGCSVASGDYLVIISGHCVPTTSTWLQGLCDPLIANRVAYTYGRQIGGEKTRYSESRIFEKYYPSNSNVPQEGFYCNNANAAVKKGIWEQYLFNEELTGCEDMELAKRLVEANEQIGYVAESCVYHYHDESWFQIRRRFEREAIALQKIMPQVHIRVNDLFRYVFSSIRFDLRHAYQNKVFFAKLLEIVRYRWAQYWGSFVGNHDHRKLSFEQKEEYFYPYHVRRNHGREDSRTSANEGK